MATSRPLTAEERRMLERILRTGVVFSDDDQPTPAQREAWLATLPDITAGNMCGCGQCPSIELLYRGGVVPGSDAERAAADSGDEVSGVEDIPRIVLDLPDGPKDAMIMLFIDGGIPSYLELAPMADTDKAYSWPVV